jgi:hypothetical protein
MVVPTVLAMGAIEGLLAGQGTTRPPFPQEPEPPPQHDARTLLKLTQKDLKRDVQRLVELAEELKKEVERADTAEVLSLQVVRKAEEIEKLAKRIKTLARG